ncbi:uncharacterized protein LOC127751752 [Frankliniella occidentalis]|uniref:Uncharacterized protein LOC127749593 n=1 Tax=Frankliniella occidentalis TaxID=133901 RepID=A0A9C6U1D8_FRAOC|nr:uncharacterized protein LOC127749593 [Frankliniella occidentalis]XP_052131720.1 uncharacterized protein LOC127751752 [Frankliniella occidentalis]
MPGAQYEAATWRKSYQDWKSECKKKYLHNKKYKNATDNNPRHKPKKLNDLEEICLKEFHTKESLEGNGTIDPDRDIVEETEENSSEETTEQYNNELQMPLEDSFELHVVDDTGDSNNTFVEVLTPCPSSSSQWKSSQVLQVLSPSPSTPCSSKLPPPQRKTESEIRKDVSKRVRKEMELREGRPVEVEQLETFMERTKMQTSVLESIATSLQALVGSQEELVKAQKTTNKYLKDLLEQ